MKTKKYTDVFKKPLTKKEVRMAAILTVRDNYCDAISLSRKMQIGFGKAGKLAKLMYDAGIIVDSTMRGTVVILKEEQAINAALRQLRKGNG